MINDLGNGDSETSGTAEALTDNIVSFIANDLLNICILSNITFSLFTYIILLSNVNVLIVLINIKLIIQIVISSCGILMSKKFFSGRHVSKLQRITWMALYFP